MNKLIIVVGAPRSGTNMLRDVLTSLEGVSTWPCDEINPIWKHGNLDVPHDELLPEHARPEVVSFLRRNFAHAAEEFGCDVLVEKTCATSMRVAFAAKTFPEAEFVFIHRDGFDAAASTMKRWNAPFDLAYTLRKVRYVPVADLPMQVLAFLRTRLGKILTGQAGSTEADLKVATWWGPRPHDFRQLQESCTLEEVALTQWERCASLTLDQLAAVAPEKVHRVAYEDFVQEPEAELRRLLDELGLEDRYAAESVATVSAGSIGKSLTQYPPAERERLAGMVGPTMQRLGYPEDGLA
ncbi:sulfotransferase family protein [Kytococcus sedentarius]|uniref:sulfotransferase family protein n=1 Tax=Kytococcus sedentarius TaxID=1276 RepID=UPI0038798215